MAYGKSPEAEEEFEFNLMGDDIIKAKEKAFALCLKLSETSPLKFKEYSALLKKLLGSVGNGIFIEPPFNCSNGKNIHVGSDFLVSSNVTISDEAPVYIGDYCVIGPNTLITTVSHPLSPAQRREHVATAISIKIGNDVMVGANVVILPGITIGNNVIVAAGAVVTRDVPDNCMVGGIPARVMKNLPDDT